jgi:hypothetical protein
MKASGGGEEREIEREEDRIDWQWMAVICLSVRSITK